MRQWLFGLAAVVLVAPAARADDKPAQDAKAVEIVKKSIKAHGGEELLNKYPASTAKMKGDVSVMGLDVSFTGDMALALPDKLKVTMNMDIMGQKITVVQLVNGKEIKMTANGMAMPVPDNLKDEMVMGVVAQEISQVTPLLDAAKYTLKAGGEAEVNGKKADVVVVSGKRLNDKELKLFFDKDGLVVKMQRRGLSPDGSKEVDEESIFEGYEKVDGIMTPTKMTVKHDGDKYITLEFSDVKYLEKIDPKEFRTDD